MLLLSSRNAAWATSAQAPYGQTVPSPTPTANGPNGNPNGPPALPCRPRPPGPPPGNPRVVQRPVEPGTGVVIENCPWIFTASNSAFTIAGTLVAQLLAISSSQAANAGDIFIGSVIDITMLDRANQPITKPTFSTPVDLCYIYDADEERRAGGAENLVIQTFDVPTSRWVAMPTVLDRANSQVCAALPHLSLYAVAIQQSGPAAMPNTGTAFEAGLPGWVWLLIILALATAIILRSMSKRMLRSNTR